jgi:hypothetical protein
LKKVQYQRVLSRNSPHPSSSPCSRAVPCLPKKTGLEYYGQRIDTMAHELVADIRPTLTPHAQAVLDEIVFQAPLAWSTNADAHRSFSGHRIVEFNAGFLAVTDWLAQAMIADWAGHDGCLNEYSSYLAEKVGHNSRRSSKGRERMPVYDFESYAGSTHGQCAGAMASTLDDARRQQLRQEILDAVTATVLLHEIAHHVLEHVSGVGNNFMQRPAARSRRRSLGPSSRR